MGALRGPRGVWRPQLTVHEQWRGLIVLALYLLVFPFVKGAVERRLGESREIYFSAVTSNSVYYAVILLILIGVFWAFLRHAGRIFVDNWRAGMFAFGGGFFVALGLTVLAGLIPLPVTNPAVDDYRALMTLAPGGLWLLTAVLRPATEEILYRGLLFGFLRKENRALAYAVSAGLFALSAVWQHALFSGEPAYLLLMVQYLPLGLVLCWSYDISGSVYVPLALRVAVQTMFLVFAAMTATPGEILPMDLN